MVRAILVRHGRTTANVAGVLAGRGDAQLDDHGRAQAQRLAEVFGDIPLAAALISPMLRTQQTAELLLADRDVVTLPGDGVAEVDYGEWTNGHLGDLGKEPLWGLVQSHPSAVTFPAGESMAAMAARAVAAVRSTVAELQEAASAADTAGAQPAATDTAADTAAAQSAPGQPTAADGTSRDPAPDLTPPTPNLLVVTHGDIIKAILADALGMHLDAFQRICVDPGSVSVVRYHGGRPFVECTNTDGSQLARTLGTAATEEAVLGGGSGR